MRRVTAAAFALYLGASLAAGEVFPFSRYDMYARLGGRSEGAVPVFLVDGAPVQVRAFRAFAGLDPDALRRTDRPCSMLYLIDEARAHIAARPAADPAAPGAVTLRFGYRRVRLVGGRIQTELELVAEGRAWR